MKVLFNKIKKSNKVLLSLYIIAFLGYLITLIFFIKGLLNLEGIETVLRIVLMIIFIVWLLVYFIWNLVNLITKRNKTLVITAIITILLAGVFGFGSYTINKFYGKIDKLSTSKYTLYTTNLIALSDTEITSDSKLGMIENEEAIEGHVLAKELIKNKKLKNEINYYEDYYSMLAALYNKEIDGIFVSNNYVILFANEDAYKNIDSETKVVYEYSKKMENKDNELVATKSLTEPFTVLVMGVDSEGDGLNANAAFNGDTLILVTFNPKTLTATMMSFPRDTYVPIACNHNAYNKINSSAAYGTSCVIDTIKQLTDVNIDYYAKINFRGFIDLVETLGGVDVDVEQPNYDYYVKVHGEGKLCESNSLRDTTNLVCMDTGWQHLNGEQALAYARNRHGFLESDIARNRHQQQIVEAVSKKVIQLKSFDKFESALDAISKNISTNMSTKQILSFYNVLKDMLGNSLNGDDFVTIHKTYLESYTLPVFMQGSNSYTSALSYYPDSLEAIKKLMKVNLGIEQKEIVKTFNYTYGENYEAGVTGKGITSGAKLQLVPDFTGSTEAYVRSWGAANGVTITTSGVGGLVTAQSIHSGVLAKAISTINIQLGGNVQETAPNVVESNTTDNNESNTNTTTTTETPKTEENIISEIPIVSDTTSDSNDSTTE